MKISLRIKKALPVIVIFAAMFILFIPSMASAYSYNQTNNTYQYVDVSGNTPAAWFSLGTIPSWYNPSAVSSITLSMTGTGFATGSDIDVYIRFNGGTAIPVISFTPPASVGFSGGPWDLIALGLKNDFIAGDTFDVGYGCHFYEESSTIDIEQTSVPEPTTMLLLGLGLVGLAGVRRTFQK